MTIPVAVKTGTYIVQGDRLTLSEWLSLRSRLRAMCSAGEDYNIGECPIAAEPTAGVGKAAVAGPQA
jgi:hypothetical protein